MNDINDAFTTSIEIEIRAEVVAQLVEWSLPSLVIRSLNPAIDIT